MKHFIWLILLLVSTNVYAQHGLMVRCGGGEDFIFVNGERVENPLHLNRRLLLDPEAFYQRVWQQAMDIKAIQGKTRVVFHNPNGWDDQGMGWSSSSLLATRREQRKAFKKFMEKANRDRKIIVGIYMCSRVPKTLRSNLLEDIEPMQLFDYSKRSHRNIYVYDMIHRFRKHGVKEFYFDASSKFDRRESFATLIAYLERKGLTGITEGIPVVQGGVLDIDHMDRVHKAIALDRFWYFKETRREWDVSTLPERHEYIVVITTHQTWDENVPQEEAEKKEYIKERMRLRFEQGLTVLNMQDNQHEDFLAALMEDKSNQGGRIKLLQAGVEVSENP